MVSSMRPGLEAAAIALLPVISSTLSLHRSQCLKAPVEVDEAASAYIYLTKPDIDCSAAR